MKKRSLSIALIIALLLTMLSTVAVLAEDDDHGADAHSESMNNMEDQEYDGETSFQEDIIDAVVTYAPYVIGAICGIVVIVIIVKLIRRGRKPKYTGKH